MRLRLMAFQIEQGVKNGAKEIFRKSRKETVYN
jgi:hypothetical protein